MRWPRGNNIPTSRSSTLPEALSVGADYGLTVMSGAPVPAQEFAEFILSAEGQTIFWQGYRYLRPGR